MLCLLAQWVSVALQTGGGATFLLVYIWSLVVRKNMFRLLKYLAPCNVHLGLGWLKASLHTHHCHMENKIKFNFLPKYSLFESLSPPYLRWSYLLSWFMLMVTWQLERDKQTKEKLLWSHFWKDQPESTIVMLIFFFQIGPSYVCIWDRKCFSKLEWNPNYWSFLFSSLMRAEHLLFCTQHNTKIHPYPRWQNK